MYSAPWASGACRRHKARWRLTRQDGQSRPADTDLGPPARTPRLETRIREPDASFIQNTTAKGLALNIRHDLKTREEAAVRHRPMSSRQGSPQDQLKIKPADRAWPALGLDPPQARIPRPCQPYPMGVSGDPGILLPRQLHAIACNSVFASGQTHRQGRFGGGRQFRGRFLGWRAPRVPCDETEVQAVARCPGPHRGRSSHLVRCHFAAGEVHWTSRRQPSR